MNILGFLSTSGNHERCTCHDGVPPPEGVIEVGQVEGDGVGLARPHPEIRTTISPDT